MAKKIKQPVGPFILKPRIVHPRAGTQPSGYSAGQLAQRYGFPAKVSGPRQTVAIIELGGGWAQADVDAYCAKFNLPVPSIVDVSVDGAQNAYTGDPNSDDGEVALDIQTVIGATGGQVDILVYNAPNNDTGIADAINAIVKDNKACVISLSWGAAESSWSSASRTATQAAIAAAATAGIPLFAASGDGGSGDGAKGNNCDYPASDPLALGCGGTTITSVGESAWSYGGGGFSQFYPVNMWQAGFGVGRGVPDLALDGDPNSGYQVVINGTWYVFGGTSAVAPMWASLVALLVTQIGQRIHNLAQKIYALGDRGANGLTDIISGSNGAFHSAVGWDACTGEGVPNAGFCAAMVGAVPPPPPPPPPSGALPAGAYKLSTGTYDLTV
jgi:kumamolisin